jgi:DNA polymerase-1
MLKTLVVDGNSLLQTGFHGVKDYYHNGKHFGAIFYFLNTIKRQLENFDYDKVVVFWDGKNNHSERRKIYPQYKSKKKNRLDKESLNDLFRQKNRISQYLEEFFIRQAGYTNYEADDCIAYYTNNSLNEEKTIITNDNDLVQLVSEKTSVFLTRNNNPIKYLDKVKIGKGPLNIPTVNVVLHKILLGDNSDNIKGIQYFGQKTLLKHFPEIQEEELTLKFILNRTKEIISEGNKERGLLNLRDGISSDGRCGEDFFDVNTKLIDLNNVLISNEIKEEINLLITETLDPQGRNNENVLKMMKEDGIFKVLPKHNDEWTKFFEPLLKLKNKEINYHNKIN